VNALAIVRSENDKRVCYRCSVVHLLFTDDSILAAPGQEKIRERHS
jgi:hypothetical protein